MHKKIGSRVLIVVLILILCCATAAPAFSADSDLISRNTAGIVKTKEIEFDGAAFGNVFDCGDAEPMRKAWTHDAISQSQAKALLNRQPLHPQRTGWDKLDARISALLRDSGASDAYGQLWYAYQWMVKNVTYSWAGYSNTNASVAAYNSFTGYHYLSSMKYEEGLEKSISDDMANRTYHILASKKGVCYDYAIAFAVIARYVGIESYVRTGRFTFENTSLGAGHHGWSVLVLDGAQYIFDPQRDARNWEQNNRNTGYYFGVSSANSYRYNPNYYSADVRANPARDATFLPITAERRHRAFVHCTVIGHGVVTGTGDHYITKDTITLRAVPAADARFDGWYDESDELLSSDDTLKFTLHDDTVVIAKFIDQAVIAVRASASGTAAGGGRFELGTNVTLTAAPADGAEFAGWYDDKDTWISSDPEYAFTAEGSGIYTAMFAGDVFWDIPSESYYSAPVVWAAGEGIAKGVSLLSFRPFDACTRAQVVTFLWRAAGEPQPEPVANPFSDVPETAYYRDAVLWVMQEGITLGTASDSFSPDRICTRGQAVTFLWRMAGSPVREGRPFTDLRQCYYYPAVLWAVDEGIAKGMTDDQFCPDDSCSRGQFLTFLYRSMATATEQQQEEE